MASTTASGRAKRPGRPKKDTEGRMSLGQHLIELRNRLFRAVIAVVVCAIGGWFLTPFVLDALRQPVTKLAEIGGHTAELNFPMITGAFDLKLQIAITIGIVISSPVWLYQIW
ncbi:MAG: twin-arginine translocase subunit TatC, partial [Curtobacterium sp.]